MRLDHKFFVRFSKRGTDVKSHDMHVETIACWVVAKKLPFAGYSVVGVG